MFVFGSGVLIGTRTDVVNATPINFGLLQDITIDESATTKSLMGQYQRPIAIARGGIKSTGKAKVARISGLAFANLFYGVPLTQGQIATAFAEAAVIPATPYEATVLNSTSFVDDGGVTYAATGLPLTLTASSPAVGQYSVAAGLYTFSAADAGKAVLINYTYAVSASGQKFTVANELLGTTPTFKAKFYTSFQGNPVSLQINNCVSSKFGFGTKLEDFTLPEFDFEFFADAANNVMTWSFGEAS